MTPEEKSLLERTYALAEDNNKMLRSIRRATHASLIMKIAYWVIIIGASVGAVYLIKPYVNALSTGLEQVSQTQNSVQQNLDAVRSTVTSYTNLLK
jgi:uncharacterized protein YoxC